VLLASDVAGLSPHEHIPPIRLGQLLELLESLPVFLEPGIVKVTAYQTEIRTYHSERIENKAEAYKHSYRQHHHDEEPFLPGLSLHSMLIVAHFCPSLASPEPCSIKRRTPTRSSTPLTALMAHDDVSWLGRSPSDRSVRSHKGTAP
jgi:hypothetical protein